MPIVPVRDLIPENIDPEIVPILNFFSDTISECVNFASNLFIWEKYKTDGEENIPPVMLLRHAVELMDSIALLIRNSHSDSAKLQLRSLLEAYFKLAYMLDANMDNRAMAFLVENILRDIDIIEKMIEMAKEHAQTKKSKEGFIIDESSPINLQEILDGRKSLLTKPKYQKLLQEFANIKGIKRNYPPWHQCFGGPMNVREISVKLGQEELYKNVYKMYSNYTHGTDVYSGKIIDGDILQIRLPQEAQQVSRFAVILFLRIVQVYIDKRVPNAEAEYKNWFSTIQENVNRITGSTEWIKTH